MKKLYALAAVTALSFSLAACGSNESSGSKDDNKKEPVEETATKTDNSKTKAEDTSKKEETNEKDGWEEKEFGLAKPVGYGYSDEAGIDGSTNPTKAIAFGPANVYIDNMTIADIKPNEDSKGAYFNDQDELRVVIVSVRAENTGDEDITFYPNQAVLVTDTGEQVESEMGLMGDAGGDFLGKVKKEGQVWYFLKDKTKDIKNIKLVFTPPYTTKDMNDLGEEKRVEFNVLTPEEAKSKDKK